MSSSGTTKTKKLPTKVRETGGRTKLRSWLRFSRERTAQLVIALTAVYLVSLSRADVAGKYKRLGNDEDVYAIPQKEQLLLFSLGYRAAFADLLFGRTMVAAGTHFAEHRVFHHLDAYLKGILALEPRYRDVYRYSEALLNLSTVEMPRENLRIARDIQEEGFKQFPHDPQLWMVAGQFMAYLAPQRLPENEDKAEWRLAGARAIQHACDIWPYRSELPDVCMAAAGLMSRNGELSSAIAALERIIAISDDESMRAKSIAKLRELSGERVARKTEERLRTLDELRLSDLPAASRLRYQLLAPPFDAPKCVGNVDHEASMECATSFAVRSQVGAQKR